MNKLKMSIVALGLYASSSQAFIIEAGDPPINPVHINAEEVVCYIPEYDAVRFKNSQVIGFGDGVWKIKTHNGHILYLPVNSCMINVKPEAK